MNWMFVLTFLVIGIISGEYFGITAAAIGAVILLVLSVIINRKFNLNIAVYALALFVGSAVMTAQIREDTSLDGYLGHYMSVMGTVISEPRMSEKNYRYTVEAASASQGDKNESIKTRIIVTSEEKPHVNDTVIVGGFIKHIDDASNEYGFSPKLYYKSQNINYKMFAEKISEAKVPIPKYYPSVAAAKIKECLSALIYSVSEGENAGIIKAVITGNKDGISDELTEALTKSGIDRFLYFSYFFIFIISFFINIYSDKISKGGRTYIFVGILLLIAVLNADKPVFIKNCIYVSATLLFAYKFGYVHKPSMLCIGIIPMLIANPLLIANGGFVLSALATILTTVFGDFVKNKLRFIKNHSIRASIASGIICFIGLLPFTAYYFNGISLYHTVLMFIYIPINIIIWICFFPAVILTKLIKFAPIFSELITVALAFYKKVPYIVEKLPFSYIYLPTPGIAVMIAAVFALLGVYLKINKRNYKPAAICCCLLVIFSGIIKIPSLGDVSITFVNVGQGDGAVISCSYGTNIIIDGGGGNSFSEYDPGKEQFVKYLISHGKTNIDAAFISHYHQDHAQGVIAALKELDVATLYLPDYLPDNNYRLEAEKAAHENGTEIKYISSDTELLFDGGLKLDIIVPTDKVLLSGDENDTSIVINAEYGDINCIFTGDMTKYSENALLAEGKIPQAEILKVAHHGSATSTGEKFVSAVNPQICVISLGENNMYDFPRESVLQALKNRTIYRTDESGDITITADKNNIKNIKTYK